ncbi:hypothetical protein CBR_g45169 [Chara braunii]|uniref:Uncharacterized protein n=1 Tax=Chara braunii TaxID=69332 RepID=A0A388K3F4_CHABU|nr:hypothetical protein CBR_g45169 [Chara braunii]|eukprot:GBG64473.1 hypothetical protein CBR_g45169 [Chara braunii]
MFELPGTASGTTDFLGPRGYGKRNRDGDGEDADLSLPSRAGCFDKREVRLWPAEAAGDRSGTTMYLEDGSRLTRCCVVSFDSSGRLLERAFQIWPRKRVTEFQQLSIRCTERGMMFGFPNFASVRNGGCLWTSAIWMIMRALTCFGQVSTRSDGNVSNRLK